MDLSPEDKKRIEEEERKKIAEERYRQEIRARLRAESGMPSTEPAPSKSASSKAEYLTPKEVAERYSISAKTVQRKVRNHPEVLRISGKPRSQTLGHKKARAHLRIPADLAERLFRGGGA